jgi:hypothetical protein
MTDAEVLGLLIYANELDGRHSPNEAKVLAWQDVLREAAPGMTVEFARDTIRNHYGATDAMLTPATLVASWKKHARYLSESRKALTDTSPERHCGRANCVCTHGDPCFKGWIDYEDATSPCRMCRGDLANTLDLIAPLGSRSEHDWATLRLRHLERS